MKVVRETMQYQYRVADQWQPLPVSAADIFSVQGCIKFLSIQLGNVHLHCHFFYEGMIELDIDPRAVRGEAEFDGLRQFIEQVAIALQQPVRLTPENLDQHPITEFDPQSLAWTYFPIT